MATLFEGDKIDERQSVAATIAPEHSLFRKRYRQLTSEQVALHDAIKDKADELARLFAQVYDQLPKSEPFSGVLGGVAVNSGAHVTIALRHLEDAVYRAVKALTA